MVPWYNLINSDSTGKFIIHIILNGTVEDKIRYVSVRAGVSFSSEEAPGAFVVVGQEMDDKNEVAPTPLTLLDEWEFSGLSVDQFWDKASDALVLHGASPVYFDTQDEANLNAFQDYCSRKKLNIDYLAAPFADNFFTGLSTANDWLRERRLDLHKTSKTREQLKNITREHLRDSPETKFPLVNALRHVLSGFRKYPPSKPLSLGMMGCKQDSWML
jgi:hypothetical protein